MKKIIVLLLISSSAWAQQTQTNKYNFTDFSQIVQVEDQEKYYNDMLAAEAKDTAGAPAYNDYRAELAYSWLAEGNLEKYGYYKRSNPKFSPIQFMYLCDALEKLADEKQQYASVEKVTSAILDEIARGTFEDPIGKAQVLMELNAVANAKLGNIELAKTMIAKSSDVQGMREIPYFRNAKSNYLHRYALILSAAGDHKKAFDILTKAFKEADSNPLMVPTFKEIYKAYKGTEQGFDQYLGSLKEEAYQKCYKEVAETYISTPQQTLTGTIPNPEGNGEEFTLFQAQQPIHDISLLQLDGDSIRLGDYKNEILVLDFWSTLCTPCVAAFSGFDRVVKEYKNDAFQLFVVDLFQDEATVKSYVAKKGITLDVLRDEPNEKFQVQGTPTKIVFDPMGNIRFYSVGYAGSTDREYYKLKAMIEIVKERAPGALAIEEATAEELAVFIREDTQDSLKTAAATETLLRKYPESQEARMQRITSFLSLGDDPESVEAHLKSFINKYPNVNLDLEKGLAALSYAAVPNTDKSMQYINAMEDPLYQIRTLQLMIDILLPMDTDAALDVATRGLKKVKRIKRQTTPSELLKLDPQATYNDYLIMYGKLLFQAGKDKKAYKYIEEAYPNIKNKDQKLIEIYAYLSSSIDGQYQEALPILAQAVREGKNDTRYIDQVRVAYKKLNPGKDVEAYIASLQQTFKEKIRVEVEKLMINKAAPNFYVTDANGKKVTLADFKGKTIVLDFWATWCGPCVESFPAMQIAVDRYVDDPNVKFLFIHTWENVDDPLTDAKNFLSKRDYDFDLYMDPRDPETKRSPAADMFNIEGIPAKFIIDGAGKIRFQVSGFNGKKEAAAEELAQMIEIARKGV